MSFIIICIALFHLPLLNAMHDPKATATLLKQLSQRNSAIEICEFEKYLEAGADLYKADKEGQTALHYIVHQALDTGKLELIKYCCKNNVDWKKTDQNEESPYQLAEKAATQFSKIRTIKQQQQIFNLIQNQDRKKIKI